ncbi:MAG: YigZ family protein [Erysipelotrichaceae bacterium]|nr:YigZ family protein [Erysipelotrichaceae bacterium]
MVIILKRIQQTYENTIIIQKSEFITRLFRVESVNEVEEILEKIRKKHYDATHNCYAYIIGDNQEIQKCSDDGEPQKTAGAPMMDALKKNNVTNILAIVTRYFGGTLLGAGGLVRAYSSSVSECLKLCDFYEVKKQISFSLTTSYGGYNTILKVIPYITISEVSFTTDVIINATCDIEKFEQLDSDLYKYKISAQAITNLGEISIEVSSNT